MVDDVDGPATDSRDEALDRMVGDIAALGAMRDDWAREHRSALHEMVVAAWVIRAQQHLVVRIESLLRPLGLSMTKFECLVVLLASRNGALGMNRMAERLGVHPTSITYAVDALMDAGLVERRAHPRDRRRKLAALTPEGRVAVDTALGILERERFGIQSLGDDRLRELSDLLQQAITPRPAVGQASVAALEPMAHRTRPMGV